MPRRISRRKSRQFTRRKRKSVQRGGQQNLVPFFIKRTKTVETDISGTPLVIYSTWHTRDLPPKMKEAYMEKVKLTPEFDHYLYSKDECLQFLKDNFEDDVVKAYNALKPITYKSDLWRYAVLYKKGGIYIDIPFIPSESLYAIVKENPTIFMKDLPQNCNVPVLTGFIASPPNNPVFRKCIDDIIYNVKNKIYGDNIFYPTGPCLLGSVYDKIIGKTEFDKLKFKYIDGDIMTYNDRPILSRYPEYRSEQATYQNTKRYGNMWMEKDIYDDSIKF